VSRNGVLDRHQHPRKSDYSRRGAKDPKSHIHYLSDRAIHKLIEIRVVSHGSFISIHSLDKPIESEFT
jgi:hypothetical protein